MDLFYREYGEGHPLVILHGLFGMGDNWATLARSLSSDYMTFTLDLRNHGRSPHIPEMSYPAMAADVRAFMEHNWVHHAYVMGHSMGGKVAMQLALDNPDAVDKLIVVDISPGAYPSGHDEIFEAMLSLDLETLRERKQMEKKLMEKIQDDDVVQFILKNVIYDKTLERYVWRMNLPIIHENYTSILDGLNNEKKYEGPTLFIAGGRSRYIQSKDHDLICKMFPAASIETIEDAGHWVHADKPKELLQSISKFLENA